MGNSVSIVILAVTKTFDEYCIAGMDFDGKWLRPLPKGKGTFWSSVRYQDDDSFIKVGDVWEISDCIPESDPSSPGHTENIRLMTNPVLQKRLSNEELVKFVNKHKEDKAALTDTLNANARSLCLIEVEEFENRMAMNSFTKKKSPRVIFSYQSEEYKNATKSITGYPITDLKWRAYTLQEEPTLNNFESIFICVGLARKEPQKNIHKEYPMIISIITDPEVPLLSSYPN